MKFWIQFLREKRTAVLLYLVTLLLLVVTGSLYHIENIGKLFYGALLTLVPWGFVGVIQGIVYVRKRKNLKGVTEHFEQTDELLLQELRESEIAEIDRKRDPGTLEEQLQQLLDMVCESHRRERDRWEEKEADRKDYYLMWAHQIKTPISAMKLLLEEAGDSKNTFLMREELFKIEQYVEMVLTFQRLDSMAADLVLQEYELTPLLRQVVRKYSVLFINKSLSVELPDTDIRVLTDEKWFSFCLEQLLSNSIKYTNKGKITFEAREAEKQIFLTVRDTGMGIRPEDLPRIFERGFTGYNGRIDKKSTGIGLYLCKQIFNRLGIFAEVDSEPGEGTRVLLAVPKTKKR